MKKIILPILTLLLLVSISLAGCAKEYPSEIEGKKLDTFVSTLDVELPDNTEIYALENNEYALVNDVSPDDGPQAYSVVLLDQAKQPIKAYSCEAADGLEAAKLNDSSNITVNKFFGGQSDFTEFTKGSDLYIKLTNGAADQVPIGDSADTYFEIFERNNRFYISPEYYDGKNFRVHLYQDWFPDCTIHYSFKSDGSVYCTESRMGCW